VFVEAKIDKIGVQKSNENSTDHISGTDEACPTDLLFLICMTNVM